MAGLKQNPNSGAKYLKIKEGKFYLSSEKENATPYAQLEGTLVDMYFKDESFEGTPQRKLYIVMNDGEDNYITGFNIDSQYASSFLGFVKNVDLTKPFTISPKYEVTTGPDGRERKRTTLLLNQEGRPIKSAYTRDNPNGLPEMKKVRVSGKDVYDKTDMIEFYENLVTNDLKPQLKKPVREETVGSRSETRAATPAQTSGAVTVADDGESDEKFPWEE